MLVLIYRAPGVDAALCKTKKTQCCRDALLRGRRASCRCVPVIGRAETPCLPSSAPLPRRQTDRRTGQRPGPRRVPEHDGVRGRSAPQPPPGRARLPAGRPAGWSTRPGPTHAPKRWANGLPCLCISILQQYHPTDITGPLNLSDRSERLITSKGIVRMRQTGCTQFTKRQCPAGPQGPEPEHRDPQSCPTQQAWVETPGSSYLHILRPLVAQTLQGDEPRIRTPPGAEAWDHGPSRSHRWSPEL